MDTGRIQIPASRLANQGIARAQFSHAVEVVRWMGMLQAQDYLGALWAVGLRLQQAVEREIELALAQGEIVRTWPARGTLHFVAAEDARWMLALLAPRSLQRSAGRMRQLELDDAVIDRSRDLLTVALQEGHQLTRAEVFQVLEAGRIATAGQRGIYILWRLAQEGLICYGARHGKQHTFALLAQWAPQARTLPRQLALAELARRYFTSHGPATLQDFCWWSGLATAEAAAGLEMVKGQLLQETIDGRAYWFTQNAPVSNASAGKAYLLPAFDEYLVAYKDRSDVLDPAHVRQINAGGGMLSPTIVLDGQVVGTWKRALKRNRVEVMPGWFVEPTEIQRQAFDEAAQQYGAFLGLAVGM